LTKEKKEAAVLELCQRDKTADEIASQYNVSRYSVYLWARELLGKGSVSSVPKRKKEKEVTPATVEELQTEVDKLRKQAEELKDEVYRLRVEKDVIRIHAALKNEAVTISEKVVRRLMKKDGLIVKSVRKRKYTSHRL